MTLFSDKSFCSKIFSRFGDVCIFLFIFIFYFILFSESYRPQKGSDTPDPERYKPCWVDAEAPGLR
jgi:hypothetical protein